MTENVANAETYLPGHSPNATDFMAKRSLESHGEFFLPYLTPGDSVLDCGCGPGSITLGIAARVSPGKVVGFDFVESQIERATSRVQQGGVTNVSFQTADCYRLPCADYSFDRVFCHALMEHLTDPVRALREFHRVLKPGGVVGVCSPDWNGLLVAPPSQELTTALDAYADLQDRRGGDLRVGHTLGEKLATAGFVNVQMSARYECYPSLQFIGEYLAFQLEREGHSDSGRLIREWSQNSDGLFAQAWVSALATKDR